MIIQDSKTIQEIQLEFHTLYPGLKIEFYRIPHDQFRGSYKDNQYTSDLHLFEIREHHNEGELTILPEMTVKTLEGLFEELYGLHVQIFRKSNRIWLQTSTTDNWTIAEQNRKGLRSSKVTSVESK
jgi:hypothetical protein